MPHGREKQIESRQLDNQGNDIDAVVEQILFLFIELDEILSVLVVLEYKEMTYIVHIKYQSYEQ